MSRFGLDYAWGHISPASHRAVGSTFACRYHSHDPSKDLSRGEADELKGGGIDIVSIWETTANRSAEGFIAGAIDAIQAAQQAKDCGQPAGRPIYFAVDFDASPNQVLPYFRGVVSKLGLERTGVYAGVRVCNGLFAARAVTYCWQTYAWSGGQVSPHAQLYQYSNGHTVGGTDCDFNRSLAEDFGQWSHATTPPLPTPPEDTEMITSTHNADGRIEVFVHKQDGSVVHTAQEHPNGDWWKNPDGSVKWIGLGNPGK